MNEGAGRSRSPDRVRRYSSFEQAQRREHAAEDGDGLCEHHASEAPRHAGHCRTPDQWYHEHDRYPSPGANHIGEYLGWAQEFLGSSLLQFFYDPVEGAPWETGDTPTWIYNLADHPTDAPAFPDAPLGRLRGDAGNDADGPDPDGVIARSGELAAPLLEGVLCGIDTALEAVNVPNAGYVPGLPEGAVVEAPARADASGLHPAGMAPLPEGILGLLRVQTSINARPTRPA